MENLQLSSLAEHLLRESLRRLEYGGDYITTGQLYVLCTSFSAFSFLCLYARTTAGANFYPIFFRKHTKFALVMMRLTFIALHAHYHVCILYMHMRVRTIVSDLTDNSRVLFS